jgi:site-specific recombinase XerD
MLQNINYSNILIGLLYGCGLRCMEARSVRLQDWILIENNKVVQGKGKKKTVTFHWNT